MKIKISSYKDKYRCVSLSKCESTTDKMLSLTYDVVELKNHTLIFYPDKKEFELTDDEYNTMNTVGEYSILEFFKGEIFVYYNSESDDNTIFITNKCNSNCIMCPVSDVARKTSDIKDINQIMKICKQIPSDTPHITITGGEPFMLKKDIFIMFEYMKEYLNDIEYLLLTNGRIFADDEYFELFLKSAPDNLMIGIPIHGYDDITHDGITRSKGSFKQTKKGIKKLLAAGIRIEIRIVVSKLNISFINEIADLIIREFKGAYSIKVMGLEMLGNARINFDKVWIDYNEAFSKSKEAIEKMIMHGFDVGLYNFPLCCVDSRFWNIAEKSISDYKVRFLEECEICRKKELCGGMFSGTYRLMKGYIKPII